MDVDHEFGYPGGGLAGHHEPLVGAGAYEESDGGEGGVELFEQGVVQRVDGLSILMHPM